MSPILMARHGGRYQAALDTAAYADKHGFTRYRRKNILTPAELLDQIRGGRKEVAVTR